MLQVDDIRQTRVYQEAKEEGMKEGIEVERQRSFQVKLHSLSKMAALKMSTEAIADLLDLDVDLVRKEMPKFSLDARGRWAQLDRKNFSFQASRS
jgi:predicted transposase YdaD